MLIIASFLGGRDVSVSRSSLAQTSYYSIKHMEDYYGLSSFVSKYESDMINAKNVAEDSLNELIEQQKERELSIFNNVSSYLSQTNTETGKRIREAFKSAGDDPDQKINAVVNFLTEASGSEDTSDDTNVGNTLNFVISLIDKAFKDEETMSFSEDKQLSSSDIAKILKSVIDKLTIELTKAQTEVKSSEDVDTQASNSATVEVLARPLKKLVSAYEYYSGKKSKDTEDDDFELLRKALLLVNVQLDKASWKNHKNASSLKEISTVIKKSVTGYGNQQSGKKEEKRIVANAEAYLVNQIISQNPNLSCNTNIVGGETSLSSNKRQQKLDVTFDFNIKAETGDKTFKIGFSIKKTGSLSNIQFHHGGSINSYIANLPSLGNSLGGSVAGAFDFLNDKSFLFTFVNSIRDTGNDTEFLGTLDDMLKSSGFLFLGEKLNNNDSTHADFMTINGKVIPYSTILKEVKERLKDIINLTVKDNGIMPMSLKEKFMEDHPLGQVRERGKHKGKARVAYEKDFISESQKIGKEVSQSRTYQLDFNASSFFGS